MIATAITTGGIAILVTAAAALIAAIGGLVVSWLTRKDTSVVKIQVNGRQDRMQRRIEQLIEFCGDHGLHPPPPPLEDPE